MQMNPEWRLPCTGRQADYYTFMATQLCQMFEYDSLKENGIELDTLLFSAMLGGVSAVVDYDGEYRCGILRWASVPDDNGIAKRCVVTGRYWSREYSTDEVAYYRNNWMQKPEPLRWFADMFAQTDSAQRSLIRNTKYVPVPVASTKTEQIEYESILKAIQAGAETAVMLRPASNEVLRDGAQTENARVLNISDPTMIDKMHYLSEYHSELKKRFATLYGMCFRSSSKSAQESVDEVHGMDNFTLILPRAKLAEMKLFAEKCKKLWGWNGEEAVSFSELWEREDESAAMSSGQQADQEAEPQKEGVADEQQDSEN